MTETIAFPMPQRQPQAAAVQAALSTDKADRAAAEAAVVSLFRAASLREPATFIWCDGPLAIAGARKRRSDNDRDGRDILPALLGRLALHVALFDTENRLSDPNDTRRIAARLQPLRRAIVAHLAEDDGRLTISQIVRAFGDILRLRRRPASWTAIETAGLSQFDAARLEAELSAPRRRPGTVNELVAAAAAVARSCGWCVPHEHAVWMGERPTRLKIDERYRLHCGDGPALAYGDGWKVYAWKGIRVPPWLIEDRAAINAASVHRVQDPLIRRCMIEIMTPERFVADGGALIVNRDDAGILWHRRWRNDAWAAVEVINGSPEPDGTFKHYFLQVPADMHTARQAVAWTYHMSERQYAKLSLRT